MASGKRGLEQLKKAVDRITMFPVHRLPFSAPAESRPASYPQRSGFLPSQRADVYCILQEPPKSPGKLRDHMWRASMHPGSHSPGTERSQLLTSGAPHVFISSCHPVDEPGHRGRIPSLGRILLAIREDIGLDVVRANLHNIEAGPEARTPWKLFSSR